MRSLLQNHPYKLTLLWALVIFGLCSMPGHLIPSATWLEVLSFDKWVHAGIFFVLVSLAALAVKKHGQASHLVVVYGLLGMAYGALLEFMQATVFVERSADWQDMVANAFGCLMALVFHRKVTRLVFREAK